MANFLKFVELADDLSALGLVWKPAVGDEVSSRQDPTLISVLVEPQAMSIEDLKRVYIWLPTFEQMVVQSEARQMILEHAGLELNEREMFYKTLLVGKLGKVEGRGDSLRLSIGRALADLLVVSNPKFFN
ncbi:MAG TPA: hypothetical protein PKD37_06420 [Oligoflexia bacterium]|nr:hypothetical protein [Oligoflexia bacterium]HMP27595.1 hypothetical protein [Oligoflexia bacterium]